MKRLWKVKWIIPGKGRKVAGEDFTIDFKLGDIEAELDIESPSIEEAISTAKKMPGGEGMYVYSAVCRKPK